VTYLGPSVIPANTPMTLSFYLTNSWYSTPFLSNQLSIYLVNPTGFLVSEGVLSLVSLYGGISNLVVSTINNLMVTSSSTKAGTSNVLSFKFNLTIALGTGSTIAITVPKSAYKISNTTQYCSLAVNSFT